MSYLTAAAPLLSSFGGGSASNAPKGNATGANVSPNLGGFAFGSYNKADNTALYAVVGGVVLVSALLLLGKRKR